MKLFAITFLTASLLLLSCNNTSDDTVDIKVDALQAENYDLDEVIAAIEIISLQDSVIMGEIFQIDMDNDYILLQDMYENKIHIYDRKGGYINTLDKMGKGPGEYTDATVYAYNPYRRQIVLNSGSSSLNCYSVPDCEFIMKLNDNHAYSALVTLDKDRILGVTSDYTDDGLKGNLQLINLTTEQSKIINDISFPNLASIIYSYNSVFSSAPDQSVYYCMPHVYSNVYKIKAEHTEPVSRIGFGNEALPESAWNQDIVPRFRDKVNSDKIHALQPQYLILNDSVNAFWYWCSRDKDKAWQPLYCYAHNKMNGRKLNIRELGVKDTDLTLVPLGIYNGYYIALVEPSLVDTSVQSDSPITQEIIAKAKNRTSPLLVLFKLNV